MDPNAALKEIREIIKEADDCLNSEEELVAFNFSRLVDLIDGLDGWISKGGFLPDDWTGKEKNKVLEMMK
jgi:hypothetical protein